MKIRRRKKHSTPHHHSHDTDIYHVPLEDTVIGMFVRVKVDATKWEQIDHSQCHHEISGEIDILGDLQSCLQNRYMPDIVEFLKPLDMRPLQLITYTNMTPDEIAKIGRR